MGSRPQARAELWDEPQSHNYPWLSTSTTFPSFLYSTERVDDKATKADQGSFGREQRAYLSLLIPLQAFGAGDT